jgi:hypothetical protein
MENKYDKIVAKVLKLATKLVIKESILPYAGSERMDEELTKRLRNNQTSLGTNPIIPSKDEITFLERIMVEKFNRVTKEYKRVFDVDEIDNTKCMKEMRSLVNETIKMEKDHRELLVDMAVNMIREEYDMPEDVVAINASIVEPTALNTSKVEENMLPRVVEIEFEDHSEMENAGKEVDKRRFINAMTQGAAMRTNHMYHAVGDELSNLNPRLPNMYNKMMSNINYLYMTQPDLSKAEAGGTVQVDMPQAEGDIPCIHAEAVTFPVLIHELVKGVMEIISGHALPEDSKLAEYAMGKADYTLAEVDDMCIGEALWERFTNMMEAEDFGLKHHVYAEMCSKPTEEFIYDMRDIMANTKRGKMIVKELTETIKEDIKQDSYREEFGEDPYTDFGDLLNDIDPQDLY